MHTGKTDKQEYPYVEPPKEVKKSKEKKTNKGAFELGMQINAQEDMLENPRLFFYVIGGLTHHEMCSVAEL